MEKLKNIRKKYIVIGTFIIAIITITILLILIILPKVRQWNKTNNEILLVFQNWNFEDTEVNVLDETIKLEAFDIKSISLSSDNLPETIAANNGKYYKIDTEKNVQIITFADFEVCRAIIDVTSAYYDNELKLNVLSIEETKENILSFNKRSDSLIVFPGHTDAINLPTNIDTDMRVIGYYPIDCKYKENQLHLEGIPFLYKNYDAEEKRDFYFSEIDKI